MSQEAVAQLDPHGERRSVPLTRHHSLCTLSSPSILSWSLLAGTEGNLLRAFENIGKTLRVTNGNKILVWGPLGVCVVLTDLATETVLHGQYDQRHLRASSMQTLRSTPHLLRQTLCFHRICRPSVCTREGKSLPQPIMGSQPGWAYMLPGQLLKQHF